MFSQTCLRTRGRALLHRTSLALAVAFAWAAPAAPAMQATVNVALTSDHVWRGTSQSQGAPAVQAGSKVAGAPGLYGSIRGSSVGFAPDAKAGSEFDLVVGWGGAIAQDGAVDFNLAHYASPGTAVDLDWTELNETLTWRENYRVQVGWSNKVSDALLHHAQHRQDDEALR